MKLDEQQPCHNLNWPLDTLIRLFKTDSIARKPALHNIPVNSSTWTRLQKISDFR